VAGGAGVTAVHVAHAGAGHPHRLTATHPHLHQAFIRLMYYTYWQRSGSGSVRLLGLPDPDL
jgi:hypothetical protein